MRRVSRWEADVVETNSGDVLTGGNKGNVQLLYILYLASVLVGITGLIGVIMAYMSKDQAPDWLKTHYNFLIRTFWIGLVFCVIGTVLMIVLIGWFILLATVVWWIVRCVKGLSLLGRGEPVANYQTWMIP